MLMETKLVKIDTNGFSLGNKFLHPNKKPFIQFALNKTLDNRPHPLVGGYYNQVLHEQHVPKLRSCSESLLRVAGPPNTGHHIQHIFCLFVLKYLFEMCYAEFLRHSWYRHNKVYQIDPAHYRESPMIPRNTCKLMQLHYRRNVHLAWDWDIQLQTSWLCNGHRREWPWASAGSTGKSTLVHRGRRSRGIWYIGPQSWAVLQFRSCP